MKTQGDDPANPIPIEEGLSAEGLTKRELFAAMAMQGLLAHNCDHFQGEDLEPTGIGKRSVDLADALITALNEGR